MTVREFSLASDGSRQYEDMKLWIESETATAPDHLTIRSEKVGVPNRFGYGNQNYLNSTTYESYHQELLKRLKERKPEEIIPEAMSPKVMLDELIPPKDSNASGSGSPSPAGAGDKPNANLGNSQSSGYPSSPNEQNQPAAAGFAPPPSGAQPQEAPQQQVMPQQQAMPQQTSGAGSSVAPSLTPTDR